MFDMHDNKSHTYESAYRNARTPVVNYERTLFYIRALVVFKENQTP